MLKMVVTDLDGTLLNSDAITDAPNLETLQWLGQMGIVRTIATGRSPYSIGKVIPDDFPIDYIIFSSGAGVIRWSDKQILNPRLLSQFEVQGVVAELISHNVDFMVHEPIPNNHCFLYHLKNNSNLDFFRRIEVYRAFCRPFISGVEFPNGATQIIVVLPNDTELFSVLSRKFPGLKVIRTTSPLDGLSIWMEIFPIDISKAYGINWLCNCEIKCNISDVVSIGNDFNDLDMLEATGLSYVVANSPYELREAFKVVPSNDEYGFSIAVKDALSILQ
jgi:hydroxymethylpyrimidine pyrophosphatase-like HAD family hydrolase